MGNSLFELCSGASSADVARTAYQIVGTVSVGCEQTTVIAVTIGSVLQLLPSSSFPPSLSFSDYLSE